MDDQDQTLLSDAVTVRSAQRAISAAIADLAARPLDVAAAEQMRRALHAPNLVTARRALDRLGAPGRTRSVAHLSVVTDRRPDGHCSPAAPPDPAAAGVEGRTVGGVA
jgi:hypothetical protein